MGLGTDLILRFRSLAACNGLARVKAGYHMRSLVNHASLFRPFPVFPQDYFESTIKASMESAFSLWQVFHCSNERLAANPNRYRPSRLSSGQMRAVKMTLLFFAVFIVTGF
jgi:hypothetical protein